MQTQIIQHIVQYVVQLGFVGLLGWGIIYYFAQYNKISVKIITLKDNYKPGEEIKGVIKLKINKNMTIQSITIKLHGGGKKVEKYRRGNNQKVIDFFSKEYSIEGSSNYLKGSEPSFNFSINVPTIASLNKEGRDIMNAGVDIGDFIINPIDNYKGMLYFWGIRTTIKVDGSSFSSYKSLTVS